MISIIAAISQNNCIGVRGDLPWDIPEDMAHFRRVTKGKPVIMGRKTWESIPEAYRPLPGRTNCIISRQATYPAPQEVQIFPSLEAALESQSAFSEVMIIGGAEIYRAAMPIADRLYITHVHQVVDGDTFFPKIDPSIWQESDRTDLTDISFVTYERINP